MSTWREDDPAGTIRLDDCDLVEMHSAVDLFAPFPDEVHKQRDDTKRGVPHPIHSAPTRKSSAWDLAPSSSAEIAPPESRGPTSEITAVRKASRPERQWVDLHAVVDDSGRLRLPENVAKQLQEGAIVEIRLAAWAVPDGVK